MRFACAAALVACATLHANVVLEDAQAAAAFDAGTGALVSLTAKPSGWRIGGAADAEAFRLRVGRSGRESRLVDGRQQHPVIERVSPHEIRLRWDRLAAEGGETVPIRLSGRITLNEGALTFALDVDNAGPEWVEAVDYPICADLTPSVQHARSMRYDNLRSDPVSPHQIIDSSFSLICLLEAPRAGLYVETEDPTERYLVQYSFRDRPDHSREFTTCHCVFAAPHARTSLTPIVLQAYRGDWHDGIDLYKRWRATWYRPTSTPAWVRDVNSWEQIQVDSPEQDYRVHYSQLPEYGAACRAAGVAAIQLVGWNRGGQDGGNPALDTDPALGTWQELHDAIARIQAQGVKVVLFGKFTWADMTTSWYRSELWRYASTDPFGIPYQTMGDSYFTPTQLEAINNHHFAIMDFLSPAYGDVAQRELEKMLRLGSAGWLYDEVCDRTAGRYNFAPGHGYAPPGYIYAGALPFGRRMRAVADRVSPDFLFAGEGPQDFLTQIYRLSYNRGMPTPLERYVDPHLPIMVTVNGFDDRERLNSILRERTIIEYEPFNFKGRLSDFPLTLAYGQKIDALRRRYRAWLWDADFRDTRGARVEGDGPLEYSVLVSAQGRRTVVVDNPGHSRDLRVRVDLAHAGRLVLATPENPDAVPTDGSFAVPPRSAAAIMEL